jgi:predicted nuclease with TOPRIM domain
MECSICHTTLANELDTFGDIHEPMCQECFFTRDPKAEAKLADLTDHLDDLECDLAEAEEKVSELQGDIFCVKRRIKELKEGNGISKSAQMAKLSEWCEKVAA